MVSGGWVYWDVQQHSLSRVARQAPADFPRPAESTEHRETSGELGKGRVADTAPSSTAMKNATGSSAKRGDPSSPSDDSDEGRRQESIRRADKRIQTLRNYFTAQPRNSWAQETEVELRRATLPQGIAFQEVSCKTDVCRVIVTGPERHAIFDAISATQRSKMTYSRQIEEGAGIVRVESFLSPTGTQWPNPFSDEG